MIEDGDPAQEVIDRLGLVPHPEGGHFKEVYRNRKDDGERGACTLIYFLLAKGERSAWHRIDAVEIWQWRAGAPLSLSVAEGEGPPVVHHLDGCLGGSGRSHVVVPPFAWQAAVSEGAWSLVECTVAPAFCFEGFELAPDGWMPGG